MSFQILQRAYAPYGTAAQFPASGDSRLIYRATDTGYLYTWDASESAYKLAGIDPATAPYLGLHAQADDAAKLGGQLPSYYAQAGHTHNYAGSSSPGGAATTALACTGNAATATTAASCTGNSATATTASSCSGNAATATKLATSRTLTMGSTGKTFDGSANVSWTLAEIGAAQKPSSGTWTPVLTADTPPTGVVLQHAYADFFIFEGWCWFTFGFLVKNVGTGGAGRIKISGLPVTATAAYTPLARPQFAVNQNGTAQLYQVPPGVNYIYATAAVPQYHTLTVDSYIEGQGFFKTA